MEEKISKKQLYGLRSYRMWTVKTLTILLMISIWFKIGLNPSWHLNDVIVEIIALFIIILNGIIGNIKNSFPIFKFRNFKFTKEFSYSITSFFVLLFLFIIYKNIVSPEFIAEIAELSFHDLCSILVFLFPISCLIIYLIYLSYKIIYKSKKERFFEKFDDDTERCLNKYKVLTIKEIFVLMALSFWYKVGVLEKIDFGFIFTEIYSLVVIVVMFIVGNKDNKLPALYNVHFKIDRYFFYSILLPYILIFIYSVFSSPFRELVGVLPMNKIISMLMFMSPLFFVSSFIFYIGCRYPNFIRKKSKSKKTYKIKLNALMSVLISFLVVFFTFLFALSNVTYTVETVLQMLIIFIPVFIIIYLVLFTGLNEINK